MSSHVDVLIEDVAEVLALKLPAQNSLRELLHRFMQHYLGAADRQKVLLNELDSLPADSRRQIVAKQRQIVGAVQALLVQSDPATLADPVMARAKTMLIFGMINWTSNWFDPAGKLNHLQIADMAFEMAMMGSKDRTGP
jgi:hypothetical protein